MEGKNNVSFGCAEGVYVRMVGGDVCSQCQLIFNVLTEIYDMGTGENHFAPTSSNVIVVVGIRNITYYDEDIDCW